MNVMVERGAVVMADAEGLEWSNLSEDPYAPNSRPLFRQRMRAAIDAMREPTAAMYNASRFPNAGSIGDQWRAMIDAALAD